MRKNSRILNVLAFTLAGLICWSCAGPTATPQYVKDGKQYGTVRGTFRHRWWNYYERGLSFADGEFYPEAIADFQVAIDQRDKDQRMARTYGMHFVDYFPHRELGVVFFQIGDLEQARRELELSLSQYPTAKARYYLDRARRDLILRKGTEILPPVIRLDVDRRDIWTRDDHVMLSGIVEDDNYVAGLSIHGKPIYLPASAKRIRFREKLSLAQGFHTVNLVALNLAGKAAEKSIRIHVDRQGPLITLAEIGDGRKDSNKRASIKGSIYDEAGVSYFGINGKPVAIEKSTETFFAEVVVPDANDVELLAKDRLGNETVARISLKPGIPTGQTPLLMACADDKLYNLVLASIFKPRDTKPPDIHVKDWSNYQTVYLNKVVIDGHIKDQDQIVELTVNGKSILRRPGRMIFFNHFVELQPGENVLTISADDKAGNRSSKEFIINREIPLALKLDQRLSISVMPFEQMGEISTASRSYQDNLIYALVNRNRFQVVERGLLETILQEQQLSRTKLVDQDTALRLGRLAAARSIITGSILESRSGIEIIARFIDTETSEILDAEDVYSEAKDLTAFKLMADVMALKFHRKFPLVGGIVIEKKGRFIFADMGEEKIGIQKRLIVYRDAPIRHPLSGKIVGADNQIIGRAMVKQVSAKTTKAELIEPKKHNVDRFDKVITE
jgi:TolB-like protein/tetratricopeptide (TPR) repeat protein